MPFAPMVQDRVPELTMAGMAALGQGIQHAGDAIGNMLEQNRKDAQEKKAYETIAETLGMDKNAATVMSGDALKGWVQGKQIKSALDRYQNENETGAFNLTQAKQSAGAFSAAMRAFTGMGGQASPQTSDLQNDIPSYAAPADTGDIPSYGNPSSGGAPSLPGGGAMAAPGGNFGAALGTPNLDERGVSALAHLQQLLMQSQGASQLQGDRTATQGFARQFATEAQQPGAYGSIGDMLKGALTGGTPPPVNPSIAFLKALAANPQAASDPQFAHMLGALTKVSELQGLDKVGTATEMPGTGYNFAHTGLATGTPIPLPRRADGTGLNWTPLPGKVGESGGLYATDDSGHVHVVQPHADSQFLTTEETRGSGSAGRLNELKKQMSVVQDAIAKKGEKYRGPLGMSTTLEDDLEQLRVAYNNELQVGVAKGYKYPSAVAPLPAKAGSGLRTYNPKTGKVE